MGNKERLLKLYRRVYSRPRLVKSLKAFGIVSLATVALSFSSVILDLAIGGKYLELIKTALASGIPFVLVSLMRYFIDCERPYEIIDYEPLVEMRVKRKSGKSFPSRHTFSAFVIGTIALWHNPLLGAASILAGVMIGIERMFLGVHFPRDVIVGAFLGVASGAIGTLIL